jgi:hypothetical protein
VLDRQRRLVFDRLGDGVLVQVAAFISDLSALFSDEGPLRSVRAAAPST